MRTMSYSGPVEVITASIDPDEKLLESIEEIIRKHDIQNGAIVSGIATLKTCQMHYIEHTDYPPDNAFYTLEVPLEVDAIQGIIADYRPHIHIVVGQGEEKTWCGHLEPESRVCYLAELCILKFNGLKMERQPDKSRPGDVMMLGPKSE